MPENQNMQKTSDNEAMLQEIVQNTETDYPQASPGAHKLMEELCAFQTGAEQAWREFV